MGKKNEKEIIDDLLLKFPEFANSIERKEIYENDGPYVYFSYFGNFVLDRINEKGIDEFVTRFFSYINDKYSHEEEIEYMSDLFSVEFFERLNYNEKYRELAMKNLKGPALLAFERHGN